MSEGKTRKKPVRKAPVQKDFATKLEWIDALRDYELAEARKQAEDQITRVETRIAAQQKVIAQATTKLNALEEKRDQLRGLLMSGTPADEV